MRLFNKTFTALAVFMMAGQVLAEADRLQADFTFKRVGLPQASGARRITVQVAPRPVIAPPAATSPDKPRSTEMAWFWDAVSPARSDTGPGRLEIALRTVDSAGGADVSPPRLQTLQDIAARHGLTILRETVGTDVSPALVLAMIAIESSGRTDALSTAGAQGLMQLMPDTASRFGVGDVLNPEENIRGGVAYLSWLMRHFDGDPILVLAGYNAGEGAVRDHDGVPPYAETRAYVPKVLAAFAVARGLCSTPPELISDGCVFAVKGS